MTIIVFNDGTSTVVYPVSGSGEYPAAYYCLNCKQHVVLDFGARQCHERGHKLLYVFETESGKPRYEEMGAVPTHG